MNSQPVLTAVLIIGFVAVVGYLISYWRASGTLRGYEDVSSDAQSLARTLKAETFRDGSDLVVSGNYGRLPAIVRFSYSDNTPGLNIRMRAPADFNLTIVPKGSKATDGRVALKTTDEGFDARFITRTDHAAQAKMFLGGKQAMAQLQKLLCSPQTFFNISNGSMEISELVIPAPDAARHINEHLDAMAKVAEALAAMPGADAIKIEPYQRERSNLVRAAIAVLVLTGIVVVVAAVQQRPSAGTHAVVNPGTTPPAGISLADAAHINGLAGWRLATEEDFDPNALGWLRAQHSEGISGRIPLALTGQNPPSDAAYVMVGDSGRQAGKRRLVVLLNNVTQFDAAYPAIAIAARVPKQNLATVEWQSAPSRTEPEGDGLLVAREANDPTSGIIFYSSGGRLVTAVPANYQKVNVD